MWIELMTHKKPKNIKITILFKLKTFIYINTCSSFEKDLMEPGRLLSLATFVKSCLLRIEKVSETLHMVVHTEPNLEAHKPTKEWWKTLPEDFHWHIEIQPDVEGRRRFLGTEGFYFNPIPAEQAALVLRALEPDAAFAAS